MLQKINMESLINDIVMTTEETVSIAFEDLQKFKLILEMYLSRYQITYEDETGLSRDTDHSREMFCQYLLDMKLRGCTENSIKAYKNDLKNFLVFVNKPIVEIKYADIKKYLADGRLKKGWKDRTYNVKLIMIRSFFSYLYEEDLIHNNPAKKLHESKVEHRIGLTINEYQREELKSACINERELALCEILYSTGARISELCALNIADVDFVNMSAIVYGKGRKEREIYFSAPAKLHLQRYLESRKDDNQALFVTSRKPIVRLSAESVRNALKKIQSRDKDISSIKLTPHVFRRSVGTDMINRGAPLELVAEKLGHVQLDTTKKCYASISKNTVHEAHRKYV